MSLAWVATDARTGQVLADLPGLECLSVKRSMGRYESALATLPLPTAPGIWLDATRPGASNLILLSDGVPIWGGMVTQRTRGLDDSLDLSLVTLESYADRRLMGDVTYAGVGQNAMVEDWFAAFVTDGPLGGIPFRVAYATPGDGTPRDREYRRADRKTVYSALTELSAVIAGPEWTVEWEHQVSPERYTPVLYVGDRIGRAVSAGMAPSATFQTPGSVVAAALVEDYSAGKGANSVIAYSSATAGDVPASPAQVATDDGRPTFEVDLQPSTSITDIGTLTSHAQAALTTLSTGGASLALSAAVEGAPLLGVDWVLGDDVGYQIGDPSHEIPAFPGGFSGVMRCIGWELTLDGVQVVTPILATTGG